MDAIFAVSGQFNVERRVSWPVKAPRYGHQMNWTRRLTTNVDHRTLSVDWRHHQVEPRWVHQHIYTYFHIRNCILYLNAVDRSHILDSIVTPSTRQKVKQFEIKPHWLLIGMIVWTMNVTELFKYVDDGCQVRRVRGDVLYKMACRKRGELVSCMCHTS